MAKHGEFSHIEFPADDLERAKSFYANVFGWQFEQMEGFEDYWLYTAGPGDLGGGFGLRGSTIPPPNRSATTCGSTRSMPPSTASGRMAAAS